MPHAIRFHATGGPDVLCWEETRLASPAPGEALIKQTAIGVNFLDTYYRSGLYPAQLPSGIGTEGAGIVEAVGPGVTQVKPGDRVAYSGRPLGSYAEARLYPADRLVPLPASVGEREAAGMIHRGMTVQCLITRSHPLKAGETILVHAAAGGIGLILCQWAKHLGATVIGTVGSEAKAKLALQHGCDHAIDYAREDFVARIAEITEGRKVQVVYDGVGEATFMRSLDCLAPHGRLVSYGQTSGAVKPFDPTKLAVKGSLHLTRMMLPTFIATRPELIACAHDLFVVVQSGAVKIAINQVYALRDAADAHRDLEARRTTGSSIMIV